LNVLEHGKEGSYHRRKSFDDKCEKWGPKIPLLPSSTVLRRNNFSTLTSVTGTRNATPVDTIEV
jgi:hypothetical protein